MRASFPTINVSTKCSSAWGFYINDSLKELDHGRPKATRTRVNAEQDPDHRKIIGVLDFRKSRLHR